MSVKRSDGLVLASVAVSSLSNFLVAAAAIRAEGSEQVIAATLILITTGIATLGILRGSGVVVATRRSVESTPVFPSLLSLMLTSVVVGTCVALIAVPLATGRQLGLVPVSLLLLAICAQEVLRIRHMAAGRARRALLMDVSWLLALLASLVASGGDWGAMEVVVWWSMGALVSALVGIPPARGLSINAPVLLVPSAIPRFAILAAFPAVSAFAVTAILNVAIPRWYGDTSFVAYRAALTICSPIAVVGGALPSVLLARSKALPERKGQALRSLTVEFGILVAAVCVVVGVSLVCIPPSVWSAWVGKAAELAVHLIPGSALTMAGAALLALPAASASALGSVRTGTGLYLIVQWLAVGTFLVMMVAGWSIVPANWAACAATWLIAAVGIAALQTSQGRSLLRGMLGLS